MAGCGGACSLDRQGAPIQEEVVAPSTLASGSLRDIELSPDPAQSCTYVPDGTDTEVWILRCDDRDVVGSFARGGRCAGQFDRAHDLAIDAESNAYTTEVDTGKRVQ